MLALEIRDLRKAFRSPEGGSLPVLDVPELDLAPGERLAVVGESGTGKTTLLHVVAGILPADSGLVEVMGEAMSGQSEGRRDRIRAAHVGYLFQTFNLLPHLTALENVALGRTFRAIPGEDPRTEAREALARVGLGDRLRHRPAQLSTGQQQRVAIARALAGRPGLVLADEPTASLDRRQASTCLDLLVAFAEERGAGLLVVTHDDVVLERFPRQLALSAAEAAS